MWAGCPRWAWFLLRNQTSWQHEYYIIPVMCIMMFYDLIDLSVSLSLRARSPGRSGGGAGKVACNYVFGIWISRRKSRCEMLVGWDNTSNDVISLALVFSVGLHSRSFPLRPDWRKYDCSVEFKFQRRSWKLAVLPFTSPPPERSIELASLVVVLTEWQK